jgi:hypothetical protein
MNFVPLISPMFAIVVVIVALVCRISTIASKCLASLPLLLIRRVRASAIGVEGHVSLLEIVARAMDAVLASSAYETASYAP